jgi:outer membrane immunogenic protein
MLKRAIVAAGTLCIIPGLAFAADLPVGYQRPLKAVPSVPFTWTGFYIGANVGGAFDNSDRVNVTGLGPFLGVDSLAIRQKSTGITGGGQVGYNYEFGIGNGSGIVIGIEADGAYTDLSKNSVINIAGQYSAAYHTSLDYLGTIRGRLGYAYDRFMVYGTGGFAYGGVGHSASVLPGNGIPPISASINTTETGFAYGGGLEYALPTDAFYHLSNTSAVTVRVEYLRYELNNNLATVSLGVSSPQVKFHDVGNIARAGVSYKF